jgi:hypothetical protein
VKPLPLLSYIILCYSICDMRYNSREVATLCESQDRRSKPGKQSRKLMDWATYLQGTPQGLRVRPLVPVILQLAARGSGLALVIHVKNQRRPELLFSANESSCKLRRV